MEVVEALAPLPAIGLQRWVKGTGKYAVGPSESTASLSSAASIEIDSASAEVALPTRALDSVTIKRGILVLGTPNATRPTKYSVKRLDVRKDGRIRVDGPVVIAVSESLAIGGTAGDVAHVQHLDLRFTGKTVELLEDALVFAHVLAPDASVQLRRGAQMVGSIIADTVDIAEDAKVTDPAFSDPAKRGFGEKAVRIGDAIPNLKRSHVLSYDFSVTYPDDNPLMMLVEGQRAKGRYDQGEDNRALFSAFVTLLSESGFSEATVVVPRQARPGEIVPESIEKYRMTREQFVSITTELGRSSDPSISLRRIENHPLLLNLFHLMSEGATQAQAATRK